MKSVITLRYSARNAVAALSSAPKAPVRTPAPQRRLALLAAAILSILLSGRQLWAQQPVQPSAQKSTAAQAASAKVQSSGDDTAVTSPLPPPGAADPDTPPPGDWAPELLDGILSSGNPAAGEALYDAAFAAGPSLIPQLQAALQDDRTAEFAAQALAFAGGAKAEQILETLIADRRNLDLRRFYLGSLGEYPASEIEQLLLNAVAKSDAEPDRTVTEAAIWALSVRSDPGLPAAILGAEPGIQDPVIRDELDNARQVIQSRLKYQASPEGQKAGGSLDQALHAYFIGALQDTAPRQRGAAAGSRAASEPPSARVQVNRTVFSPDKNRALAHVAFKDPEASASYDIVLQKELGDWTVVSVWEGPQIEKPEMPSAEPASPRRRGPASRPVGPAHTTTPSN